MEERLRSARAKEEIQFLRDPTRLAAEGILLTKKKSSAFFSDDKGLFILSLKDVPLNVHFRTPKGNELVRLANKQVMYTIPAGTKDGKDQDIMISIVDGACIGLLFLPDKILGRIFSMLDTSDLLRSRLVNRAFRSLSDPRLPGELVERLSERMKLEVAIQGADNATEKGAVQRRAFSHLASLAFTSVVKVFNAGNPTQKDYLTPLPLELFLSIVHYLGPKDVAMFSSTSYSIWRGIEQNEEFIWKKLFETRWKGEKNRLLPVAKLADTYSWKLLYLLNEALLRTKCINSAAFREVQAKISGALETPATTTTKTVPPQFSDMLNWTTSLPFPRSSTTTTNSTTTNRITTLRFSEQFFKLKKELPTFPKVKSCRVNLLVIGPADIGKSTMVNQLCFGKAESDHAIDLDVYGKKATVTLTVNNTAVSAIVFTLSRPPDYNDLFNVGGVIVCFDMAAGWRGVMESLEWVRRVKENGQDNVVVALAGLRSDLARLDFCGSTTEEEEEEQEGKEEQEKEKETEKEKNTKKKRLHDLRDSAARSGVGVCCEICTTKPNGPHEIRTLFYHLLSDCLPFPELWLPPISVHSESGVGKGNTKN